MRRDQKSKLYDKLFAYGVFAIFWAFLVYIRWDTLRAIWIWLPSYGFYQWAYFKDTMCTFPVVMRAVPDTAANCLEFWLNRYQTFVVGVSTLLVATITAALILRQIRIARLQTAIARGDLEPEFWLEENTLGKKRVGTRELILYAENPNRRSLEIIQLDLLEPPDLEYEVVIREDLGERSWNSHKGKIAIYSRIDGTRPSAPTVARWSINLVFAEKELETIEVINHVISILMRVECRFNGEPPRYAVYDVNAHLLFRWP
ncbi:MAG: hypothetical protein ACLPIG_13275 [Methylocella sp.]|jgi:hypothetical protein